MRDWNDKDTAQPEDVTAGNIGCLMQDDLEEVFEEDNDNMVPEDTDGYDKRGNGTIMSWVKAIVIALICSYILNVFVFERAVVEGTSMVPTLKSGDSLYEDKFTYLFSLPERGDVVIFDHIVGKYSKYIPLPDDTREVYVKRVIGLPGETVDIGADGFVYINGRKLIEPYILSLDAVRGRTFRNSFTFPYTLKEDEIFVLGDNREDSRDSRDIGPVNLSVLRGKALFRFIPLDNMIWLDGNCYLQ